MNKRQKGAASSVPSDPIDEPIVVPFRGIGWKFPSLLDGASPDAPPVADEAAMKLLADDVVSARLAKLAGLAKRYGINLDAPGAGLELALRIAIDHHPGFKIVYDDVKARTFHRLHGFTPFHPLKGKAPKQIGNLKKWEWGEFSELLEPEFLSLLIAPAGDCQNKVPDREICENFVNAADPEMEKRKNARTADSRAATLNRRLSEGRRKSKINK